MTEYYPAQITDVAPRSVAARAGLRAGDVLLVLNGMPLRDVIDVQFYAAESDLEFLIERAGRQKMLHANRRYGQALGLAFETELFDGNIRACRNNCDFCFVSQMPPLKNSGTDLRAPLYVKDDDYRLSFLHGNYITLTNLDESDWERIEEQHLSPLYVSVHATEPDVRVDLMHNPRAGQIMEHLTRLADMDIEVHTQAVLVPGRNDGAHLDRTIADLASLYPAVADVTVVPVGLTRWHHPDLRPYTDVEASVVLAQTLDRQTRLRAELDIGFVYPSDEWFLRAGVPVPALADYDGLLPALIENGVGMVRQFLDGWNALQAELAQLGGPRQTWVTGTLFAPVLQEKAATFIARTGLAVDIAAVPNHTFGETVTVAGLLTVGDILAELQMQPLGDVLVLPDELFRGPDGCALDDRPATEIQQATGRPVFVVALANERWQVRAAVL
jgi:putative radical SAM enzyme (TIGR03279 family)